MLLSLGGIRTRDDDILSLASLGNLSLLLFSDVGVTVTSGTVSRWADQSGNGNDAVPLATGPTRTASDASYNGYPSLVFSGSNNGLISSFSVAQPDTVYIVGETAVQAGSNALLDGGGVGRQILTRFTTGTIVSYAGTVLDTTVDAHTPTIFSAVFNGASSAVYLSSLTAAITGNPGTGALNSPCIGGISGDALNGKIVAAAIFSVAHDATTRARVMPLLAKKYGIALH